MNKVSLIKNITFKKIKKYKQYYKILIISKMLLITFQVNSLSTNLLKLMYRVTNKFI